MGVKLVSSSGGSVEINPPTTASNFTATMPAGTGNVVVSGINSAITAATAQASTSGTSIDFTSIPSWVRRVTVMLNSISTNGSSIPQIQLGTSGGVTTSGYTAYAAGINGGTAQTSSTSGHIINNGSAAANTYSGNVVFNLINGNNWIGTGMVLNTGATGAMGYSASTVGLGGTLDRVRITTVGGTDTFDAGSINILYE
jgi:hypothetical protein